MLHYFFCSLTILLTLPSAAQNMLRNGSFEDGMVSMSRVPNHWINGSGVQESPPDLHSAASEFFNVLHLPADGQKYVGMVSRDNFTFESIGQRLRRPLEPGHTYELRLWVSHSETMESTSRRTKQPAPYVTPIPFDVFVSNRTVGSPYELIYRSEPVAHTDWIEYKIEFEVEDSYKFIRIGAGMDPSVRGPVNGNVLIDGLQLWDVTGSK